ncbi:MAG: ABC-type Fe3+ transport system, periplasmic component [halophilic archaeon J07HB67]|jgi:ABC-type Fe3+ transport system, periplasmic component|nr:MAG: ABC-type Fe3+ transport system, periplasmic component [halophilic archaeon J07HB67]
MTHDTDETTETHRSHTDETTETEPTSDTGRPQVLNDLGGPKPGVNGDEPSRGRRRFLAAVGSAATVGIAGCAGVQSGQSESTGQVAFSEFRGSGRLVESRPAVDAPRIADLPDLSGELTIYLGGGEGGLYRELVGLLERIYDDFVAVPSAGGTAEQANKLLTEGEQTPADVFWSVDAGSLSVVAEEGLTAQLASETVANVPSTFHPDRQWVANAGRARAIPYNTEELSASDVPDSVMAFPDSPLAEGGIGWAPTYGAFQAFVTAMRLTEGESATRDWLEAMQPFATEYPDEFLTSNAVADGEVAGGFANHYYALRVRDARPEAALDLAFTSGDAGALINVAGAAVLGPSDNADLAENFVAHLLSAEAQEFFATRSFGYPTVEGVPPVGGLPTIDELEPPEIDLSELSNVQPTLRLMREVGVL